MMTTTKQKLAEVGYWVLILGVMFAIAWALSGCGRPTVTEFLTGVKVECDASVTLPAARPGEQVTAKVTLEKCREVAR